MNLQTLVNALNSGDKTAQFNWSTAVQSSNQAGWKQAFKNIGEVAQFKAQVNENESFIGGPIQKRLFEIIDIKEKDGRLTPEEIRDALSKPWHAQSISRLIAQYESEWYADEGLSKWEALNCYMTTEGEADWTQEKERIKSLLWWRTSCDELQLPQAGTIYHIHTNSLLSNFTSKKTNIIAGKITFDAEGNDIPTSQFFSRVIHWPGNAESGVTLGRGYDMGSRSQSEIYNHMRLSGVPESQAQQISVAHGLKGSHANNFVTAHRQEIGEITREQQINLFNLIYPNYVERAISNYNNWTADEPEKCAWETLDPIIQDILVDFVYQGFTQGPRPMKASMNNSRPELINYIESTPAISQYEPGRHRADYVRNN